MSRTKDKLIEEEGRAEVLRKGTSSVEIIFERSYSAITLPDIYSEIGDAIRPFRNDDACYHVVITRVE